MWEDWNERNDDDIPQPEEEPPPDSHFNFDFLSLLSKPKDYYGILEVDYDATEDVIRSNYIRLALKWHPDKQKDPDNATLRFQEINEAYQGGIQQSRIPKEVFSNMFLHSEVHQRSKLYFAEWNCGQCIRSPMINFEGLDCFEVLSDPVKRREYDKRKGLLHVYDFNMIEFLDRNKGLILTCNGLGIRHSIF